MGRLLRKGGITVFNDILIQPDVSPKNVPVILDRFHLNGLASAKLYDKNLQAGGLSKIVLKTDGGESIINHFGY